MDGVGDAGLRSSGAWISERLDRVMVVLILSRAALRGTLIAETAELDEWEDCEYTNDKYVL